MPQRFYSPKMQLFIGGIFAVMHAAAMALILGATWFFARGAILPRALVSAIVLVMLYAVWTVALVGVWVGRKRVVVINPGFFRIVDPKRVRSISLDESGSLVAPTSIALEEESIRAWGIHARLTRLSGGSRQDALAELKALRAALEELAGGGSDGGE